jgi:hypothetical protein
MMTSLLQRIPEAVLKFSVVPFVSPLDFQALFAVCKDLSKPEVAEQCFIKCANDEVALRNSVWDSEDDPEHLDVVYSKAQAQDVLLLRFDFCSACRLWLREDHVSDDGKLGGFFTILCGMHEDADSPFTRVVFCSGCIQGERERVGDAQSQRDAMQFMIVGPCLHCLTLLDG